MSHAKRALKKLLVKTNTQQPIKKSVQDTSFNAMLRLRFESMEKAGYEFHQKSVNTIPSVHQWVLKENYFDYALPL